MDQEGRKEEGKLFLTVDRSKEGWLELGRGEITILQPSKNNHYRARFIERILKPTAESLKRNRID